jgi:hypothetical protein
MKPPSSSSWFSLAKLIDGVCALADPAFLRRCPLRRNVGAGKA